jgi:hypothetical protein
MRYGFDSNFNLATREQKAWLTSRKRERHCYERSGRILVISYFLCCIALRPQPHKERPSHFGQDRQVKMWNDEGRIGSTDRCTSVIVGRRDSNRKLLVEVSWANRGEFLGFRSPIWLRGLYQVWAIQLSGHGRMLWMSLRVGLGYALEYRIRRASCSGNCVLARSQLREIDLHLCRVLSSEFLDYSHVVSLLIVLEL